MKQEEIQILLNRYLDGDTTCEEEQILRHYFNETQLIPTEWRNFKALFQWEHSLCCDTVAMPKVRHHWRHAAAAAITVLLLVGAGITVSLLNQSATDKPRGKQDYAIIDGRLTTDAALIAQEAEQALMMVTTTEEETFDALNIIQL